MFKEIKYSFDKRTGKEETIVGVTGTFKKCKKNIENFFSLTEKIYKTMGVKFSKKITEKDNKYELVFDGADILFKATIESCDD